MVKKTKTSLKAPKVLLFDIETAPIIAYVWGLFDQNVGLDMVKADWHLLSYSAKWLGNPKVMYMDQRKEKNIANDKKLLLSLWKLLDEADIVITQNGKKFDVKKFNARLAFHGIKPYSSFRHIDTLQLAKRHFAFTSNKLEYMSDKLCTKFKKLKHKKFPGFELWKECLAGNTQAWNEMMLYNKHDVLALEELYTKLAPWDTSINFNMHNNTDEGMCNCGSTEFAKNGFQLTSTSRYQRYMCKKCGAEYRDKTNLLSVDKKQSMKVGVKR